MLESPELKINKVTSENIKALSEKQTRDAERRICELSAVADAAAEISAELLFEGMDIYAALAVVCEGISKFGGEAHGGAMAENVSRLNRYVDLLSEIDRVHLSELYIEKMRERGVELTLGDFLISSSIGGRIAYVKNGYSDEAYDVFSQEIAGAKVSYVETLKSAVGALLDERAQFCLLPLEERGARIGSVYELLFLNELKIVGITPVFGYDGAADMKYALVSKSYRIPRIQRGDEPYIEIMFPAETEPQLGEMLVSCRLLGHKLYRVKSASIKSVDGARDYYTVIMRGGDFTALLVYLTLFAPGASVMGIYKNLE